MQEIDKNEILYEEKISLLNYMKNRSSIALPRGVCRKKNAADSILYRKSGNILYRNSLYHNNELLNEKTWKLYSQSIALAPNNSEELALGYGNRSAILFHFKEYRDCVKDCDRAINITNSVVLKFKLLCRKAECLSLLHDLSTKDLCKETSQAVKESSLTSLAKNAILDKLRKISVNFSVSRQSEKINEKSYYNTLSNFPRLKEAPCASQSVAIKYNKKWGRHIVATRDIKPGEIVSIEDNFFTFIYPDGMYLFCSNCTQPTWSSIPCEHCIYDVYCSESCRLDAWLKYHQFECPLYPYLWDINQDIKVFQYAIRLLLIAVYKAGGINEMREQITEIENCQDMRTRGFSEGTFCTDKPKSVYSLLSKIDTTDSDMKYSLIENTCTDIYYLAKYTNFFGKKLNLSPSEMFLNKNILFVAALLLHTQYITPKNGNKLSEIRGTKIVTYAISMTPFTSLYNHSCDSNVNCFVGKDNKTVTFATRLIEKGSQLFLCYDSNNILNKPTRLRQEYLQLGFDFTCDCLFCKEDWSTVCLPSIMQLIEFTPTSNETLTRMFEKIHILARIKSDKEFLYNPKLIKELIFILETIASNFTVYCKEYNQLVQCYHKLLHDIFGYWNLEVPKHC